ncbi:hypothetical protein [Mesorhizobium sp. WSM3860]|uniref:helix-turn-helix transcriptional regulator n=1 Tax=Mesorhizobium sp. WSM3860 TaxID=2029403 RepID=UPI000BB08A95|nr:hypothetical protein [Mesorhizobium sp. WSM3860]PBC00886.1 hypothetical protein CK220_28595 [Mesorhizobium sp. WSM3860]
MTNQKPFGSPIYLNQQELAARWRISARTLERWRWLKVGPNFFKLSGKVTYALDDVQAYERRRRAETHSSILGSWGD